MRQVCTFNECGRMRQRFVTRDEWFNHELTMHMSTKEWKCKFDCDQSFDSLDSFQEHLKHAHKDISASRWVERLIKSCEEPSSTPEDVLCVLCGTGPLPVKQLKNHLGSHQEEISLLALSSHNCRREGRIVTASEIILQTTNAIQNSNSLDPHQDRRMNESGAIDESRDAITALPGSRLGARAHQKSRSGHQDSTPAYSSWRDTLMPSSNMSVRPASSAPIPRLTAITFTDARSTAFYLSLFTEL